jgi:hypothetical protein
VVGIVGENPGCALAILTVVFSSENENNCKRKEKLYFVVTNICKECDYELIVRLIILQDYKVTIKMLLV